MSPTDDFIEGGGPAPQAPQVDESSPPDELIYWVLFASADVDLHFEPIVARSRDSFRAVPLVEFDRDIVAALDFVEYCFRLPRSPVDTLDLSPRSIDLLRRVESPHRILLLPWVPTKLDYGVLAAATRPTVVFAPDHLFVEVQTALGSSGAQPLLRRTSELTDGKLGELWSAITDRYPSEDKRLRAPPVDRTKSPEWGLAFAFLDRQWPGVAPEAPTLLHFLELSVYSQAYALLHEAGVTRPTPAEVGAAMARERRQMPLHVTWGASGHAPAHARFGRRYDASDKALERRLYRILVQHRSTARTGASIISRAVPAEAFALLDRLERHFRERTVSGRFVWRILDKLGRLLASLLSEEEQRLLRIASDVTVFSPFPLGLAILPGSEVPLSCTSNVAYEPVEPLTRAVQTELLWPGYPVLQSPVRVLVAECLDPDDRIHGMAAAGWEVMKNVAGNSGDFVVDIVQIGSEPELRSALALASYDVLVLSGHGYYDPRRNTAAFCIGQARTFLLSIGRPPPVVLLSACHVAPRAHGVVNVGDLLLRQGAVCVLGTLVPVDVRRNAVLMTRLMIYMCQAVRQRPDLETLADVWRSTMTSNAVHEVLEHLPRVRAHDLAVGADDAIATEFKLRRSPGRLHAHTIYTDTLVVLQEILAERGQAHLIAPLLRTRDFIPESLFYVLLGAPDRVWLRRPRGLPSELMPTRA